MGEDLAEVGQVSFGVCCWRGGVHIVDVGPFNTSASTLWEEAIRSVAGRRLVVYTDCSKDDGGRVGSEWYSSGNGAGSVVVGNVVTVWDVEIAGIRQAVRLAPDVDILVLTDLKASLLPIKRSVSSGKGRTRDLVEVVNDISRPSQLDLSMEFG